MPWETVDDELNPTTERMEVPGGWLYRSVWRHQHTRFDSQNGCGMAFVPRLIDGLTQVQANIAMLEAIGAQKTAEPDPVTQPPEPAPQPEQP